MADWRRVPLGQVFDVQLGKMLGAGSEHGDQFQYLANRNVQWGQIIIDELGTMNFSATERKRYRLQSGDLLVCEGGEVGRAALWSDELPECYFQNALHRLRATSNTDPRFMRHYFEFAAMAGSFRALTGQTSIGHLPRANLVRWLVPVPPLEEQRRIAEILDTIDETIKATERVIAKLELLRIGLAEDLIPMGRLVPLEELASVTVGFVGPTQMHYTTPDRGVPFLRTGNIGKGHIRGVNMRYVTHAFNTANRKSVLRKRDVVVSRVGYTGNAAVVGPPFDGANCANMIIIRPGPRLESGFLSLLFESRLIGQQVKAMTAGSAQPVFNIKLVEQLRVPSVGLAEQIDTVNTIHGINQCVTVEQDLVRKLTATRGGLSADLLSGRLRTMAV